MHENNIELGKGTDLTREKKMFPRDVGNTKFISRKYCKVLNVGIGVTFSPFFIYN